MVMVLQKNKACKELYDTIRDEMGIDFDIMGATEGKPLRWHGPLRRMSGVRLSI